MSGSRPLGGGSGTVTSVGSGTGLTGGPITASGTLSFADVADQRFLGNYSGGALAPQAMALVAGTGITFSGTTTSLTITCTVTGSSGGTVTQIDTGTGLTGGPITTTGTISISFSGASAKMTADQTGADYSSGAAVPFNDEDFDDGGWHSTVTSSSRLTPPATVTRAAFTFNVAIAAITSDTSAIIEIRKNGANTGDGTAALRLTIPVTTYLASVSTGAVKVDVPGTDYWEAYLVLSDTSVTISANRTSFNGWALG